MIRPEYLPDEISDDTLVFLRQRGVIREDNTIDAIRAFHEMDAYRVLISNATRVYDQLGGYTQETTLAEAVIAAAVLREEQQRDEAIDDHTHYLREELAAATEALISFETGAPNPRGSEALRRVEAGRGQADQAPLEHPLQAAARQDSGRPAEQRGRSVGNVRAAPCAAPRSRACLKRSK